MNRQRVDVVDFFYVVDPHLPFAYPFSVWEIVRLPKVKVRYLLCLPPLQLELSFHECDLVSANQICHVRFYFERECREKGNAMRSTLWWGGQRFHPAFEGGRARGPGHVGRRTYGIFFCGTVCHCSLSTACIVFAKPPSLILWPARNSLGHHKFFTKCPFLYLLAIVGLKVRHWYPEKLFPACHTQS